LTIHNLTYTFDLLAAIRVAIETGTFVEFRAEVIAARHQTGAAKDGVSGETG
jgi:queuine/archaeosine tRNA-ribosyltransferase